jgi:hypothetical protein
VEKRRPWASTCGKEMTIMEYRIIPLTKGQFAKVSPCSYEELMQFRWHAIWSPQGRCFNARRWKTEGGKKIPYLMHRQLLGLGYKDPRTADHINHDTLDNRLENLRIASRAEQVFNRRKSTSNTTGFKGVFRITKSAKFRAAIKVKDKQIHLGWRDTAEAAYRELYVPAVLKYHGEFACFE